MPSADRPAMHLNTPAGQPLTIALAGNPGGGWLWHAPAAPAGCQLDEAQPAPAGAGEGGAVQQRFVFSGAAAGSHPLRFEQRRGWEGDPHAVQVVHVSVT